MSNSVKINDIIIGEGIPKICVPIIGQTRRDIMIDAGYAKAVPHDIVEWRADYYEDLLNPYEVVQTISALKELFDSTPIIFTIRTVTEGGEAVIDDKTYLSIIKEIICTSAPDIIDVEIFKGDDIFRAICLEAHNHGIKIIASNHDFLHTPSEEELISRMCHMQNMGADIAKIAVMPESIPDVLTLLSATAKMATEHTDTPVVTMSMGKLGKISRLSGETFGSAITFGIAATSSAPGQINCNELSLILKSLHS